MSNFHQQAIEDVAGAVGLYPITVERAIRELDGHDALAMAYAVAQRGKVLELEARIRFQRERGKSIAAELVNRVLAASTPEKAQP